MQEIEPAPATAGEWTPEWLRAQVPTSYSHQQASKLICDAHNAAIAAEREQTGIEREKYMSARRSSDMGWERAQQLREQIQEHQAEYDRLSQIIEENTLTIVERDEQLATAQAVISKHSKEWWRISTGNISDTSCLDAAIADAVKPYRETLELLADAGYNKDEWSKSKARTALLAPHWCPTDAEKRKSQPPPSGLAAERENTIKWTGIAAGYYEQLATAAELLDRSINCKREDVTAVIADSEAFLAKIKEGKSCL